jgi:hypothetical protein
LIKPILPWRVIPPLITPETAALPLNLGAVLLSLNMENHPMEATVKSPVAGQE